MSPEIGLNSGQGRTTSDHDSLGQQSGIVSNSPDGNLLDNGLNSDEAELRRFLSLLVDAPFDQLHKSILNFDGIYVFGENHDFPRGDEIITFLDRNPGMITHIVLEVAGDDQKAIDEYFDGNPNALTEKYSLDELYPYGRIIEHARKNGIKVIAGDMTIAQVETWVDENRHSIKSTMDLMPNYDERHLLVQMLEPRSKITGEKVKKIIIENPDAKVVVSCGAGHVALIATGYYGIAHNEL